jgi:hypothetical protein
MPRKPSYPGPYLMEIEYFTTISSRTLKHVVTLNVSASNAPAPGATPISVLLHTVGGGTITFAQAASDFWSVFRLLIPNVTTANTCNLYRVLPESYERIFITSATLSPATGAGATAPIAAREDTLTFRTGLGGYMQISAQETANNTDTIAPLLANAGGTPAQRVAAWVLSASGVAFARDGSAPVAPKNLANTQNEAIYKKRNRSS